MTRLLLTAVGAVAVAATTASDDGLTLCPFALISGTACPGCGLTRATGALIRGDLSSSLAYHPLVVLVVAWTAGFAWSVWRRRHGRETMGPPQVNRLLWASAALFVVTWVVRFSTGSLPPV